MLVNTQFVNFNIEEVITFSVVGRAIIGLSVFLLFIFERKGNISRKACTLHKGIKEYSFGNIPSYK